jgi:hypothetical protein
MSGINETLVAQQQAQLLAQQNRIALLESTLAQTPPIQPTVLPVDAARDPKVPDVPLFTGDSKKCFEFLSQLNIFFKLQPSRFSSDLHRSYYLGIRCSGPAAVWFSNVVSRPSSDVLLSNFQAFVDQFAEIFADPTRVQDAERRLLTLKQGKRSVAQLLPEFQTLVFITGWDEKNLFRIFLDTLNDDVRDELLRENRPSKFHDYVTRAIAIDRQLVERKADRIARRPLPPAPPFVQINRPIILPPVDHSRPMDLSSTQTRRGPLTEAERQHRFQNHLCIICADPGHLKSACPRRRVDFPSRQ